MQAQAVIKQLGEHMPISRAQMRLLLSVPAAKGKAVKERVRALVHTWEGEEWTPDLEATVLIDPGSFRAVDQLLRDETRGAASFEVLSLAVVDDADEALA